MPDDDLVFRELRIRRRGAWMRVYMSGMNDRELQAYIVGIWAILGAEHQREVMREIIHLNLVAEPRLGAVSAAIASAKPAKEGRQADDAIDISKLTPSFVRQHRDLLKPMIDAGILDEDGG
jgi:hypothetical protein